MIIFVVQKDNVKEKLPQFTAGVRKSSAYSLVVKSLSLCILLQS